jgi:signal peptidase I
MATKSEDAKPKSSFTKQMVELVVTIAVAVILALLIQAILVKPYRIPSASMVPTLQVNQRVLTNRLDTSPSIGDIVVFHPPRGADPQPAVCGNPAEGGSGGGTNSQPCGVPTPAESTQTFIKRVVGLPGDHIAIVNGHVLRNSVREPDSYIARCAVGASAPCNFPNAIVVPPGEYFMMGDNRGESDDSRFWGPVPKAWIIGVAFFTYWPPDRIGTL